MSCRETLAQCQAVLGEAHYKWHHLDVVECENSDGSVSSRAPHGSSEACRQPASPFAESYSFPFFPQMWILMTLSTRHSTYCTVSESASNLSSSRGLLTCYFPKEAERSLGPPKPKLTNKKTPQTLWLTATEIYTLTTSRGQKSEIRMMVEPCWSWMFFGRVLTCLVQLLMLPTILVFLGL
jgi:hypothetical protein